MDVQSGGLRAFPINDRFPGYCDVPGLRVVQADHRLVGAIFRTSSDSRICVWIYRWSGNWTQQISIATQDVRLPSGHHFDRHLSPAARPSLVYDFSLLHRTLGRLHVAHMLALQSGVCPSVAGVVTAIDAG